MDNKKIILTICLFLLLLIGFSSPILAEEKTNQIYIFYSQSCPYADQAMLFLGQLMSKYDNLAIHSFATEDNQDNEKMFYLLAQSYGLDLNNLVYPTIFFSDQVWAGFDNNIARQIEQQVARCQQINCPSLADRIKIAQQENNLISNDKINIFHSLIFKIAVVLSVIVLVIFLLVKL